ncbi:MAG: hypothetical protein K0S75_2290 [Clostridia bacterium]|jgi:hypothetical protein|nr:hypothetical protein [Clostridia bacterium]
MKIKVMTTLVSIILMFTLFGCSNDRINSTSNESKNASFYGIYTFEEVSYLSGLSSSTIDYKNEQMAGTKYTIEANLFKIESAESTYEIKSPNYVKEEIPEDINILSDVRSYIGNEVECQYSIYPTHWRLYVSSNGLWISSYADNTADGSEIIMDIYKLSK